MSTIGGTYGLSGSGMDIDTIVQKLMSGQKTKTDTLLQKKMVLQLQKTAYNKIYDEINNFRSTVFNYKLESTLNPNKVSSSNTTVVTATANASAADVNHSLVVAQLASGVNLTSTASITTTGANKSTLATQLGVTSAFTITIGNGTASKAITINPTDSINDVVSAINSAGVNVQANYDNTLDRFFLSTTNMGSAAGISISSTVTTGTTDAGAAFIKKLKLFPDAAPNAVTNTGGFTTTVDAAAGTTTTKLSSSTGLDAEIKLDGVHLTQATNSFTISGVSYSLTGVSPNVGTGTIDSKLSAGQVANVSVTSDVDAAVASIKSLVDSYNKILAEINSKVKETRYTDYPPLTDAQKAEMKDSEITAWNAKAESGMLHSDPTLSSLLNTVRNSFASIVTSITGTYNSASSIGITTGDYTEGGKLYLDTTKLKTALNANPNVLTQLFGAAGTTTTSADGKTTTNFKTQGIAGRLYDGLKTTMDKLNQIASTTSNSQYDTSSNYYEKIRAVNKQITYASDKYDSMQTAYYKQYNAMEVALSALSSQSSWLSNMLSSSSS